MGRALNVFRDNARAARGTETLFEAMEAASEIAGHTGGAAGQVLEATSSVTGRIASPRSDIRTAVEKIRAG